MSEDLDQTGTDDRQGGLPTVSNLGLDLDDRRRQRSRRGLSFVAVLVALAVLVGGGYVLYSVGLSSLRSALAPPPDYRGRGSGQVLVQVHEGDSSADIAQTLVGKGVVKSADAFTDAAKDDPRSMGIQVGFYEMRLKMSASSALRVLLKPANLIRSVVPVPEGLRVDQVVDLLVRRTDFSRARFERVLAQPKLLGLPAYAHGNPEGYLFPATYEVAPDATPRSILASMVTRYKSAVRSVRITAGADRLGYSPHDVMTVASIVQAEGRRSEDFPKIARVIYNRLERRKPLQLDTTIVYIFRTKGKLTTTKAQRSSRSPYNTYRRKGLPPTPISAPGTAAIKAALKPANGSWLYFVTTDPDDGAMSFATSYRQHLRNVAKFRAYCRTHHC